MRTSLAFATLATLAVLAAATAQADPDQLKRPPSEPADALPTACPPPARVARLLRVRRGQTLTEVRCQAGRFPRPGLAIGARIGGADELAPSASHVIVVGRTGRRLARLVSADYADATGVATWRELEAVVDLDGDGRDEVLVRSRIAGPLSAEDELEIYRGRRGRLARIATRPLGHREPSRSWLHRQVSEHAAPSAGAILACDATVAVTGTGDAATVEIVRVATIGGEVSAGDVPAGFCTPARERVRL